MKISCFLGEKRELQRLFLLLLLHISRSRVATAWECYHSTAELPLRTAGCTRTFVHPAMQGSDGRLDQLIQTRATFNIKESIFCIMISHLPLLSQAISRISVSINAYINVSRSGSTNILSLVSSPYNVIKSFRDALEDGCQLTQTADPETS